MQLGECKKLVKTQFHRIAALFFGLLLVIFGGCGKQTVYPVSGTIVDADGKPITELKGGAVEFESLEGKSSANGSIDENGKFRLTSKTPGDGAELGKHRVVITRPYIGPENPVPHVILPKYEKHGSSGLEVTVEPKNNVIELKVERIKR